MRRIDLTSQGWRYEYFNVLILVMDQFQKSVLMCLLKRDSSRNHILRVYFAFCQFDLEMWYRWQPQQ